MVLASTPLYPEGGGQPADFGWLQACEGAECGHPSQVIKCCSLHYVVLPVKQTDCSANFPS